MVLHLRTKTNTTVILSLKEVKLSRSDGRTPQRSKSLPHFVPETSIFFLNPTRGFRILVPVVHCFIQVLTSVSMVTSLNSDEFVIAYACFFVCFSTHDSAHCFIQCTKSFFLCLPSKAQMFNRFFFAWGHQPSIHVRRARFLTSVGDLI